MWASEFEELLRQHCRFVAADSPIAPDELLVTLGVDSFALLTMIVEIEETFGVLIPDEMLTSDDFHTPAAVWRAIVDLAPPAERVS